MIIIIKKYKENNKGNKGKKNYKNLIKKCLLCE